MRKFTCRGTLSPRFAGRVVTPMAGEDTFTAPKIRYRNTSRSLKYNQLPWIKFMVVYFQIYSIENSCTTHYFQSAQGSSTVFVGVVTGSFGSVNFSIVVREAV